MAINEQIEHYINSQSEPKRSDMQALHHIILGLMPTERLWFLDGKNEQGKIVSNPNIGYGQYTITYADGKTRDFYKIGMSANSSGISIYIMGMDDRDFLAETYGKAIGKAAVSGYCIRFKKLQDINLDTLQQAMQYRIGID